MSTKGCEAVIPAPATRAAAFFPQVGCDVSQARLFTPRGERQDLRKADVDNSFPKVLETGRVFAETDQLFVPALLLRIRSVLFLDLWESRPRTKAGARGRDSVCCLPSGPCPALPCPAACGAQTTGSVFVDWRSWEGFATREMAEPLRS